MEEHLDYSENALLCAARISKVLEKVVFDEEYIKEQIYKIILSEDEIDELNTLGELIIENSIKIEKKKIHYKYYCNECAEIFPEDNELDYTCNICGGELPPPRII